MPIRVRHEPSAIATGTTARDVGLGQGQWKIVELKRQERRAAEAQARAQQEMALRERMHQAGLDDRAVAREFTAEQAGIARDFTAEQSELTREDVREREELRDTRTLERLERTGEITDIRMREQQELMRKREQELVEKRDALDQAELERAIETKNKAVEQLEKDFEAISRGNHSDADKEQARALARVKAINSGVSERAIRYLEKHGRPPVSPLDQLKKQVVVDPETKDTWALDPKGGPAKRQSPETSQEYVDGKAAREERDLVVKERKQFQDAEARHRKDVETRIGELMEETVPKIGGKPEETEKKYTPYEARKKAEEEAGAPPKESDYMRGGADEKPDSKAIEKMLDDAGVPSGAKASFFRAIKKFERLAKEAMANNEPDKAKMYVQEIARLVSVAKNMKPR